MEKENDLVGSSQGSDSQLSEAVTHQGTKTYYFKRV